MLPIINFPKLILTMAILATLFLLDCAYCSDNFSLKSEMIAAKVDLIPKHPELSRMSLKKRCLINESGLDSQKRVFISQDIFKGWC